jgi:hypothetical protein
MNNRVRVGVNAMFVFALEKKPRPRPVRLRPRFAGAGRLIRRANRLLRPIPRLFYRDMSCTWELFHCTMDVLIRKA